MTLCPAFANVGAACLLTHCVQILILNDLTGFLIFRGDRRLYPDPVWLSRAGLVWLIDFLWVARAGIGGGTGSRHSIFG